LATQVRQRHGLEITVASTGTVEPSAEDTRVFLFQAVRELLANMVKHSGARSGRITMGRDESSLRIAVEDDGVGLEPAAALETHRSDDGEPNGDADNGDGASAAKHSFGLFNIRERLRHLGGRLEVDAAPGRGARFVVVVPAPGALPAESGSRASRPRPTEGRTA
jgi:signal transduction histidine kinase